MFLSHRTAYLKIQRAAEQQKKDPKDFCDEISQNFIELAKKLNLTNTDFIRTTEDRHKKTVSKLWNILEEKYNKVLDLMHIYIENYFATNIENNNFFQNFRVRNKINKIIYNINSINNEIKSSFYEINLLLGIK